VGGKLGYGFNKIRNLIQWGNENKTVQDQKYSQLGPATVTSSWKILTKSGLRKFFSHFDRSQMGFRKSLEIEVELHNN
jgi:hypothetical protein